MSQKPAADDRGAVTAEFVIVLPAALLIFGLLTSALQLQLQETRLFQAAAVAAREVAWGSGKASDHQGVVFQVTRTDATSCVTAKMTASSGWLAGLVQEERQCLPNLGY